MGEQITLQAADGQSIPAYVARPSGTPRGAVVVLQEPTSVISEADFFQMALPTMVAPQSATAWRRVKRRLPATQ